MKLTKSSAQLALVLSLLGGTLAYAPSAAAEANPDDAAPVVVDEKKAEPVEDAKPVEEVEEEVEKEDEQDTGPAVAIDGGDVTTDTVIDISADGGTAISDASGGDENFAFTDDDADAVLVVEDDEGPGGVLGLFDELTGGDDVVVVPAADIAAAGNGGTADASANGGVVTVGDINSGGNTGNSIEVGDIGQAPVEEAKPIEEPKPVVPEEEKKVVVEAPKVVEQPKVVEAPKAVAPKQAKVVEVKAQAPKAVAVSAPSNDSGNTSRVRNVRGSAADGNDDTGTARVRAARANTADSSSGNARAARAARGSDGNDRAASVSGLPSTGTGAEVLGESGVNGGLAALAAVGAAIAAGFGFRRRSA